MHTTVDKILVSLAIIIVAFTYFSPYKSVNAEVKDYVAEKAVFYEEINDLDKAISHYHETQNNLINSRVKKFIEDVDKVNIKSVKDESECTEDNYSAFCTANKALKEFAAFEKAMNEYYVKILPQDQFETGLVVTLDAAANNAIKQNKIDSELSYSAEALKLAIKSYGEFLKFYPLHQTYEKTINLMQIYNNKLAEIRANIDSYPFKFIDATTTKCI